MALALLRAGARVTAVASRPSPQLDETLARADALGVSGRLRALTGDVRDFDDCRSLHA